MQAKIMKKAILQLLITLFIFFSSWYLLSRVDWVDIFQVEKHESQDDEFAA